MKAKIAIRRLFHLFLLLPLFALAACTDHEEEATTGMEPNVVTEELQAQVASLQERATNGLEELNNRIAQLSMRLESQQSPFTDTLRMNLEDLKARRDALQADLVQLVASSEAQFISQRDDIQTRWNELEKDLETLHLKAIESHEDFEMAVDSRLYELEMEMSDLQRFAEQADSTARVRYAEQMVDFKSGFENLKARFTELKATPEDSYQELRTDLAEKIAGFGARLREATNEAKENASAREVQTSNLG